MNQRTWSFPPVAINLLLHYHYSPEVHHMTGSQAHDEWVRWFVANDVLKKYEENPPGVVSTYLTTARGKKLVQMICDTPLPERQVRWIDPRGEVENKK